MNASFCFSTSKTGENWRHVAQTPVSRQFGPLKGANKNWRQNWRAGKLAAETGGKLAAD